jgi:hypothetical protein
MRYSHHYPNQGNKIVPYQSWNINFTNPIESEEFDPKKDIKIIPEVKSKITASYNTIHILPQSKGQTKYEVKIKTSIKDVYGQNLVEQKIVEFNVGKAYPLFQSMGKGDFFILDPTTFKLEDPSYSIMVANVKKIKITLKEVDPKKDYGLYKLNKIRFKIYFIFKNFLKTIKGKIIHITNHFKK